MHRYVLYARKSSESEDRQVQSIDAQLDVLRRLAERHGFDVAHELVETRSAKSEGTRPVFAQMLRLLKTRQADAVLCWSINRLSRNPEDSGRLAGMLQRGEVKAIQTPERCYRPEDNVLLWAVDAGMANQDILELRRNTARGMAAKVAQGWSPHRAPEGYLNTPHLPRGTRTILPDPDRFPLIQRAFGLILAGTHSAAQAHTVLTEEWGYTTRTRPRGGGGLLPRTTFYNMCANIFYAGHFREGEDVHPGAHVSMLTLTEFGRLRSLIERERPAIKTRLHFTYARLIRCAHCGRGVTAEEKRKPSGKTYRYYHCKTSPCRRYHVREEALDAAVEEVLAGLTIDAEVAGLLRGALSDWSKEQAAHEQANRAAQAKAAGQVQRRLSALLDLKLDGLVGEEEYRTKREQLTVERLRLEAACDLRLETGRERDEQAPAAAREPVAVREAVEEVIGFHEDAWALFTDGDVGLKRALARLLGASYLLERGELQIEVGPVFRPILRGADKLQNRADEQRSETDKENNEEQSSKNGTEGVETRMQSEAQIYRFRQTTKKPGRTVKIVSGSGQSRFLVPSVRGGSPNSTAVELLPGSNRPNDERTKLLWSILDEIAKALRNHDAPGLSLFRKREVLSFRPRTQQGGLSYRGQSPTA